MPLPGSGGVQVQRLANSTIAQAGFNPQLFEMQHNKNTGVTSLVSRDSKQVAAFQEITDSFKQMRNPEAHPKPVANTTPNRPDAPEINEKALAAQRAKENIVANSNLQLGVEGTGHNTIAVVEGASLNPDKLRKDLIAAGAEFGEVDVGNGAVRFEITSFDGGANFVDGNGNSSLEQQFANFIEEGGGDPSTINRQSVSSPDGQNRGPNDPPGPGAGASGGNGGAAGPSSSTSSPGSMRVADGGIERGKLTGEFLRNAGGKLVQKLGLVGGTLAAGGMATVQASEGDYKGAAATMTEKWGGDVVEAGLDERGFEATLRTIEKSGLGSLGTEVVRPLARALGADVDSGLAEDAVTFMAENPYTVAEHLAGFSNADLDSKQREITQLDKSGAFPGGMLEGTQIPAHIALKDPNILEQVRADLSAQGNVMGLQTLEAFEVWEAERMERIAETATPEQLGVMQEAIVASTFEETFPDGIDGKPVVEALRDPDTFDKIANSEAFADNDGMQAALDKFDELEAARQDKLDERGPESSSPVMVAENSAPSTDATVRTTPGLG